MFLKIFASIHAPLTVCKFLSNHAVKPFIILSDINMPKLNGFELREKILANDEINTKCVSYIFLSTSKNHDNVFKAYSCQVQGYFKKENIFLSLQNNYSKYSGIMAYKPDFYKFSSIKIK